MKEIGTLSPTIRIDDDVFEALKSHAEPFVDTPNSVLRRILGLGLGGGQLALAASDDESPAGAADVAAAPRPPAPTPARRSGSRQGSSRRHKPQRAKAGSILDDAAYELPLLEILSERGGQAPAREVLDELGVRLSDRLTPSDHETLGSGSVRWKNRAQFVRLRLVNDGDMVKESPRGVWELSEQGRQRVEKRR